MTDHIKALAKIQIEYPMIAFTKNSTKMSFFETMKDVMRQFICSQVSSADKKTMKISFLKLRATYFKYG